MRLSAIQHLEFGRNPQPPQYTDLAAFFAERSAPYDVGVDTGAALPGNRNNYAYLSTRLLDKLTSQQPDLIVVAHGLPDCGLETSISGRIQHHVGGQPMVFAVSEQGRVTGFAAVRAAQAMAARGRFGRAAVLILDQGTVPYPDPALAALDRRTDHAVGLLFTAEGRGELTRLQQLTRVSPREAGQVLAAELARHADLAQDDELVIVVSAGPHSRRLSAELEEIFGDAEPFDGRYRLRQAPHGQLCTAVWAELARELALPASGKRTVIVVDYDAALGYQCLLTFDIPPIPPSLGAQ